ncbi:MAG: hypothetical protein JSU85_10080 [Candidatus Zixiibacteriota bacterium]|nr:MAG: hypothetical protein JSU85_10080 [candidate division Zixibacteria bacterium]
MSFKNARLSFTVIAILLVAVTAASLAHAQESSILSGNGSIPNIITSVPRAMTYQGILKDSGGNPVIDSVYSVTFRIYDAESGGTSEWSEILPCTTSAGYFTAIFSNINIPFDEDYWLELEVDSEILTPRQKITMVGYSARSDTSDYAAAGGGWVDDGLNVHLETSYDKVGIGTSGPVNKLHVTGSESLPILNVEQYGSSRAARFFSQNVCALWVEHAGNHGLRVTSANGDGIRIESAGGNGIRIDEAAGWAGYFGGKGYFEDSVGIGTSTPTEKLDVVGSAKMDGFKMPTSASDGYVLTSDGSGTGTWQAAPGGSDSDWVIVDTNMYSGVTGNVGIGTSTPVSKLEVEDASPDIRIDAPLSGEAYLRFSQDDDQKAFVRTNAGGDLQLDTEASGQEAVTILNSNANVGIGIPNPLAKLHVAGTARMDGFALPTGASNGYVLTSDGSGTGTWQLPSGGSDSDWVISGNDQYSGVSGNVGIGTPIPSERLHVYGNIKSTGTIESGNAIVIDGSNNRITSTYGNISFDDENLVTTGKATIGPGNFNSGQQSFIAGRNNNIHGDRSVISGGEDNTASNDHAAVGGGRYNDASGTYSTIGGGYDNNAIGTASNIGGGQNNNAQSSWTTISGGRNNTVSYSYSTIGGGIANSATGQSSTIGGGTTNTVTNYGGTIGGGGADTVEAFWGGVSAGYHNIAGDAHEDTAAYVGGGYENSATAQFSSVCGGRENTASGDYATVGGGTSNDATGISTTVGGGDNNTASYAHATVGGGMTNTSSGNYSTVGGGFINFANQTGSTISGGYYNIVTGVYSAIGGGGENSVAGVSSAIGGGWDNTIDGDNSAVPGGYQCNLTTKADYSMAFGKGVYIDTSYRAAFFEGDNSGFLGINRDDNDGGILYPIHIGTGTSNGNGARVTTGGVWTNGSSRSFKENGLRLDGTDLLNKISNLNVESWNFIDSDERHIGPYAEEFVDAFDVGDIRESDGQREDHYLAAGDVAGVALAGVKELIDIIEELKIKNAELENRIAELENR